MTIAIIGSTIADAQAYKARHSLTSAMLISPQSFHARYNRLAGSVERYYVTKEALSHPNAHKVIATVQTYMRHTMDEPEAVDTHPTAGPASAAPRAGGTPSNGPR